MFACYDQKKIMEGYPRRGVGAIDNLLRKVSRSIVQMREGICTALSATAILLWTDGAAGKTPVDGAELFRECAACHQVGAGARNKVGPHLDGIIGRRAGSVPGFQYSGALQQAGESGLVWSSETLDLFLQKPRTFVSGNRMSYRGMPDETNREILITWLSGASSAEPGANLKELASASEGQAPGFTEIILTIKGDPEYGEYLAGDCVTCHQVTGQAQGIPSIVGIPPEYFIRALVEYKTNVRSNEVMKLRVQNLTNEDIAALAAYFSELEPQ